MSVDRYLEADLLVECYGSVTEGDSVAEASLPLDRLLGDVHHNLGSLCIRVEKERAAGKGTAHTAALDGKASLGFVVTSVGCRWERATKRVYKDNEDRKQTGNISNRRSGLWFLALLVNATPNKTAKCLRAPSQTLQASGGICEKMRRWITLTLTFDRKSFR